MSSDERSRRIFLARIGARRGAALLPACVLDPARAPATDGAGDCAAALIDLGLVIDLLRPTLAELSRGTLPSA